MLQISWEPSIVKYPESNELSHQDCLDEFLVIEVIKSEIIQTRTFVEHSKNTECYTNTENYESGKC